MLSVKCHNNKEGSLIYLEDGALPAEIIAHTLTRKVIAKPYEVRGFLMPERYKVKIL